MPHKIIQGKILDFSIIKGKTYFSMLDASGTCLRVRMDREVTDAFRMGIEWYRNESCPSAQAKRAAHVAYGILGRHIGQAIGQMFTSAERKEHRILYLGGHYARLARTLVCGTMLHNPDDEKAKLIAELTSTLEEMGGK